MGCSVQMGDFFVSTPWPLPWVTDKPGTAHVHVDVGQAVQKVVRPLHQRAMVTVTPKRARASVGAVVPFGNNAFQVAHQAADLPGIIGDYKQMDVVGGHAVREDRDSILDRDHLQEM